MPKPMILLGVLALAVHLPVWSSPPIDNQAKKVLAQAEKALGGKKLKKVKAIRLVEVKSPFLSSSYTFSFPDKFIREVKSRRGTLKFVAKKGEAAVIDYDKNGKAKRVQELTKRERRELMYYGREFVFPLVYPLRAKIQSARYEGKRRMKSGPLKGRQVRIVDIDIRGAEPYRAYFSVDYKFLLMIESTINYHKLKGRRRYVLYDQYKEVSGVFVPHKIYLKTKGEPKRTLQFKVVINPKLTKGDFTIPQVESKKNK